MALNLPFKFPAAGYALQIQVQTNFDALTTYVNAVINGSLTASRAVVTDSSGFLASATTTATEIGYVNGVTSAIQTQIDSKLNLSGGTLTGALTINPATNQLVLGGTGGGRTVTITAPQPATSSRTWTIPDLTTSPTFAALEGSQTFSGAKTFSATLTMSGATIAMGSQKITGLANGTAATDAAAYGQLKVLQVVSATTATKFSTTSSTFQTTNLSASITLASTSSRVLIIASGHLSNSKQTLTSAVLTLARGGSNLLTSIGQAYSDGTSAGGLDVPATLNYVDSPASVSALTYAVQIRSTDNVSTVSFGDTNTTQSIILMEIG